ncbi:MAG: hypothetical protein VW338_11850 [Rhodospirillaceae bacterium]
MARTANTTTSGETDAAKPAGKRKSRAKAAAKPESAADQAAADAKPETDAMPANETSKTAQPAQPTKSGGGGWVAALVVLALIVAAGYLTRPKWMPLVADKLPKIPSLKTEDPRVANLSARLAALESKAGELAVKDETIQRLEQEREKLSAELGKALHRLETVEQSMASVRQIAESAAQMDEATQAKESLKRLSDRLAAIENAGKPAADKHAAEAGVAELRAAEARSRELADRLSKLEKEQAALVPADKAIAGVEKRLEEIERRATKGGVGAAKAALVLAVGQLRDAVQLGGGFERELQAVKGMAAGDAGIDAALLPLATYAKTGVPTLAMLRDDFAAMAGTVVSRAGTGGGGWLEGMVRRLGTLVRVRRIDGAGADSVEGLVARAEKQLAAGDLAGAIAALEGVQALSPDAAKAAQPWLGRAKMRAGAERTLAALHIHAVSLLDAATE